MMDRRTAMINMSLATAGLGLSSSFISLLSGCESKKTSTYNPLTFTADQDLMVQHLTELIIPTTDTPGAQAAGVHQYIDLILAKAADMAEKEIFLNELDALEKFSDEQFRKPFVKLKEKEQITILQNLELESKAERGPHFFSILKSMTIYGYYTSEIGATQELKYVHAAGRYDGDIPYEEVGKNYF